MKSQATPRVRVASGFSAEVLEMHSKDPQSHIIFIPGNPGIISFYKNFIEALYELLEGNASITAIGHISHTRKDWESGRLFSLQDQIVHKMEIIAEEVQKWQSPVILVGHSIGAYICLEIFRRLPQQIAFVIGLYPFLTLNKNSVKQSVIGTLARSSILSMVISSLVSFLGSLPHQISRTLVKVVFGQSWSATAVDATQTHLLKYHTMRNVLFMTMTEFAKLSEAPDWQFMTEKQNQIALLFGVDDHWGSLSFFEEVSRRIPGLALTTEREGHMHAYCCTEAGSTWVAHYVVTLIRNQRQ